MCDDVVCPEGPAVKSATHIRQGQTAWQRLQSVRISPGVQPVLLPYTGKATRSLRAARRHAPVCSIGTAASPDTSRLVRSLHAAFLVLSASGKQGVSGTSGVYFWTSSAIFWG